MTNHLIGASSPYLLQHARNPVDWYPWGAEAFEKAKQEDKPIFLSIGYSACHWCHVMAHESFEDADTAALMNNNFISVKVDREERPDLDSIYMNFIVAMTGQGGWPMSVFLTPDGMPFYGGTYFPPSRGHNLPAFREVLQTVARLWQTDRISLIESGENIARSLRLHASEAGQTEALSVDLLERANQKISQNYDWQNGGWGGAPKFPQPILIEYLLRRSVHGEHSSREIASHALRLMAQGGMYDVLGGGFSRYSVDPTWLVPHFEKMLYDNAQLALAYLHAYQLTGDPFFRQVCESSLDFVLRELTYPQGGFFSSLDADSEGEEGKFYLWTPDEIRAGLPNADEAKIFLAAYGVSEQGNFEGRNLLRRRMNDDDLARQFNVEAKSIPEKLADMHSKLLNERNKRVRPATDDKILVSWNALMLCALAETGRALHRQDYVKAAIKNGDFILTQLFKANKLMRSWREGVSNQAAYLEDYAGLALAMLVLYQTDFNPRWYRAAMQITEQILAHFADPAGGFFDTSDEHETLLYRPKDLQDNSTPSGNAQAAMLLLQLAAYEGRSDWRELAEKMLSGNAKMMEQYPSAFGKWLCVADFLLEKVHEVAIIGDLDDPGTVTLINQLWKEYRPNVVMAASASPAQTGSPALLTERSLLNGKPTAYVCQDFICNLPVNDPAALQAQLSTYQSWAAIINSKTTDQYTG